MYTTRSLSCIIVVFVLFFVFFYFVILIENVYDHAYESVESCLNVLQNYLLVSIHLTVFVWI